MIELDRGLRTLNDVIKVVNTLASVLLAILSIILIHRLHVLKYRVPLIIITISALLIFGMNMFEMVCEIGVLKIAAARLKREQKKMQVLLITLNFLVFGSSIGFINNLISKESFGENDKKFIVTQLAFLLLQQLTFFSMLKTYKHENNEEIEQLMDPEALVMKPMRIPAKNIQNKSSEQTLTANLDWLQQHELDNGGSNAGSVNKYDIKSFKGSETSQDKSHTNKKWKRAFGNLVKFKKQDVAKKSDSSVKTFNFSTQPVFNTSTQYYNDTRSTSSQLDLSHDVTIMLDLNNRDHRKISSSSNNNITAFSDSFEKKLDAEQDALTRINSRLLPPRLSKKNSYNNFKYGGGTTSETVSGIPSNQLESPLHDIQQIPHKFHNNLQIINNHDNVSTNMVVSHTKMPTESGDAIDFLDNFFSLNKRNYHQTQPSLDMLTSQEIDEEMINSALSDSVSKHSVVNTLNENNYNTLNSRHSPTKSISSLMMIKHKKTHSLLSNSALSTSPKKNTYAGHAKHSHSKTLSTKLSLSNISFNINQDGKIDFTAPKIPDFEVQQSSEFDFNKDSLWEQNLKLNDIEEKRKVSDKSFDYPNVLVSEYDKEKWKIISDYS